MAEPTFFAAQVTSPLWLWSGEGGSWHFVTIPAEAEQLRLDYHLLTNELTPSLTNDTFTVELMFVNAESGEAPIQVDTFATMYPTPLTGYAAQTGFRTLVADLVP